jgi:hypothetical protein
MPRKITPLDVTRRIAMRAALATWPPMTQASVARLFHASLRTVNDAAKQTVEEWITVLRAMPAQRVRPLARASVAIHGNIARPDNHPKVQLNSPDSMASTPAPVNVGFPEPVIDYKAIEQAINKAVDDPTRVEAINKMIDDPPRQEATDKAIDDPEREKAISKAFDDYDDQLRMSP